MDVVFSSLALTVLSPVMLIIALLIKLTSKGGVFFVHRRETVGGRDLAVLERDRVCRQGVEAQVALALSHFHAGVAGRDDEELACAVEVGGDHESFVGKWVGWGRPCTGAGAQLELARLTAPHGNSIWIGERQRDAAALRVNRVEIESNSRPLRDICRAVAHATDIAGVGAIVRLATNDADPNCKVGGQFVRATTQNVALVEQCSYHAGQRLVARGLSLIHI